MTKTYELLTEEDFERIKLLKGDRVAVHYGRSFKYSHPYIFKGIEKPSENSPLLIKLQQFGRNIFVSLDWLYLLKKT